MSRVTPASGPLEVGQAVPHKPQVMRPVAFGDSVVWVSGVTPGSVVSVLSGNTVVAEIEAAEPIVAVPVTPINDRVRATARLGARTSTSPTVYPIVDPCVAGSAWGLPLVINFRVALGSFAVPQHARPDGVVDGGFDVELAARVYLALGARRRSRPLVVIAHGYWVDPQVDELSLDGYEWLAQHLARRGAAVVSVDLSQVNRQTGGVQNTQQYSRGEVLLAVIDRLTTLPLFGPTFNTARIGLVGHSMGGEGVVVAEALNRQRPNPHGIRGVVSLAPTNYRPEIATHSAAYLQLHGSLDYLLTFPPYVTGGSPRFGGPRLYDRAWRHRTLAWIDGARHTAWNSVWLGSGPDAPPGPLSGDEQQAVGRCLITAFFLDTLFGQSVYRGYLAGPNRSRGFGSARVYLAHQSSPVNVVEDCGDADEQLEHAGEQPPDKSLNRLGAPVAATGAGLDVWEDVSHVTLPRSVHDTTGVDLAWSTADVIYETGLDSLHAVPSDFLSINIAQRYDESSDGEPDETWNPIGQPIDLLAELDDGTERATVRLGAIAGVPYPLSPWVYSVFRTLRLPLDAFAAVNPALRLGSLRYLRLRPTRSTGRILFDDIELVTVRGGCLLIWRRPPIHTNANSQRQYR
jgi:dienelactone hydrolase